MPKRQNAETPKRHSLFATRHSLFATRSSPLAVFFVALPLWCGCSLGKDSAGEALGARDRPTVDPFEVKDTPTPRILPKTYFTAGQMLERQGDLEHAIQQYEKAISSDPRFTLAYNRLGIVYEKLGRFPDADLIFRRGIEADPRGIEANPTAAILRNNLGYSYLLQSRLADAEEQFREALSLSAEFKRARMNLAIVLARRGRLEESVVEFSRVVPPDVAHFNVAVLCADAGDFDGAERSLRQALALNPECPGAKERLAQVVRLARRQEKPRFDANASRPAQLAGDADAESLDTP